MQTLNLLPPEERKVLAQEKQGRLVIILCFEFLVFLICLFLVLLAIEFYILGEVAAQNFLLSQSEKEESHQELLRFKEIMQDYNQKLVLFDSFRQKQKFVGKALKALLLAQRPTGLYFTEFSMQDIEGSDKLKVSISGFSDTRDNLIVFKNRIETGSGMENIVFSPESWISPKNINFNLTLEIIDGK